MTGSKHIRSLVLVLLILAIARCAGGGSTGTDTGGFRRAADSVIELTLLADEATNQLQVASLTITGLS